MKKLRKTRRRFSKTPFFKLSSFKVQLIFILSIALSTYVSVHFSNEASLLLQENTDNLPVISGPSPSSSRNSTKTTSSSPHETKGLPNKGTSIQQRILSRDESTSEHTEIEGETTTTTSEITPTNTKQQQLVGRALELLNVNDKRFEIKATVPPDGKKLPRREQTQRTAQKASAREPPSNSIATTTNDNRPEQNRQSFPKVLIAITSTNMMSKRYKFDFKRRHIARNTWLSFDSRRVNTTIPIPERICSLQEYQSLDGASERDNCRIVYTFLLAGHVKGNYTTVNGKYHVKSRALTMDPSLFNGTFEKDLMYMDVNENDRIGLGWAWFKHVQNHGFDQEFDYVALGDADTVILPGEFWANKLFRSKLKTRLYAGYATPIDEITCAACFTFPTRKHKVMARFVLLSKDLIPFVAESDPYQDGNPALKPNEVPQTALANVFYGKLKGTLRVLNLKGIQPLRQSLQSSKPSGLMGDTLQIFDEHKDKLLTYDDPKEVALIESSQVETGIGENPRVVLGIFSMDSPKDKERRNLIRSTYLSFMGNRICSLNDLLARKVEEPAKCQMAYTFVIGGNPMGPTELVEFNSSFPLTIQRKMEDDIVILNIKENMKEGKSQTWLKYALTVLDNVYFDYIAKADSDTMIFPKFFLDQEISKMPRFPDNMRTYAGDYRVKIPEQPEPHLGPIYMGGFFYFMSPDLARYVTSPQCNRAALAVWSEDQSVGNFVHSHQLPIRRRLILQQWWKHPLKEQKLYRRHWRYFLLKWQYRGLPPPGEEAPEEPVDPEAQDA